MPDTTILLAAGGTGGHLFPAEALAQELLSRGHRVVIATDKRGQAFKSLQGDVTVVTVRSGTFQGGLAGRVKTVFGILAGVAQSFGLLWRYRPSVVAGFGGYPSFPPVLAAQLTRVPTVLHEQNGVLGKANKVLAPLARRIAASLPDTDRREKTVVTGNPVRAPIAALAARGYRPPETDFRILVTGGSQGARSFAAVVSGALLLLPPPSRARLDLAQQCLPEQAQDLRDTYRAAGIRADVRAFFDDMPARLAQAHLFIGRSGATTVAEIAVAGLPALFVPDPRHADMQQKVNAETVTRAGGGWLMLQQDFTPQAAAAKIAELMDAPEALASAAAASKSCGRPDAAARLADLVETVACGERK